MRKGDDDNKKPKQHLFFFFKCASRAAYWMIEQLQKLVYIVNLQVGIMSVKFGFP